MLPRLRLGLTDDEHKFLALHAEYRPQRVGEGNERRLAAASEGHNHRQFVALVLGDAEDVPVELRHRVFYVMLEVNLKEDRMASFGHVLPRRAIVRQLLEPILFWSIIFVHGL